MNRIFRVQIAALLLAVCGCAHGDNLRTASRGSTRPMTLTGPDVQRHDLEVDLTAVPAAEEIVPSTLPDDAVGFRELSESETQELAAARSTVANLLVRESDAVAAQGTKRGVDPCSVDLLRASLLAESVMERNRAAGDALEALLLLTEAEDGLNRIAESLRETTGMGDDLKRFRDQGLAVPATQAEISAQHLELLHQLGATETSVQDLNRRLGQLLAVDGDESCRIWPGVDLRVDPTPLDVEAEISKAMATRADLALLVYLRNSVTPQTLPAIREALAGLSGGLGLVLGKVSGHRDTGEAELRRGQLDELIADRRNSITRDVRSAVANIDHAMRRVALSNDRVKAQIQHLDALDQQRTIGASTPIDVRRARLDLIAARQQLFHDVIQWKIAFVRLRAAQGLLAEDCGCGPPSPSPARSEAEEEY